MDEHLDNLAQFVWRDVVMDGRRGLLIDAPESRTFYAFAYLNPSGKIGCDYLRPGNFTVLLSSGIPEIRRTVAYPIIARGEVFAEYFHYDRVSKALGKK